MALCFVAVVVIGYLLGNLNGAIIASRMFSHEDVREKGSGNAGLTNFVRSFGAGKAIFVIVMDVGKAVCACLLGRLLLVPYGQETAGAVVGAVAVSLGHDFPVFFGFKGGKGIVCGATVAACLDLRCFAILVAVFAICFAITRYVSLSSILAATAFGICFALFYRGNLVLQLGVIFIAALAVFMHRSNIARLISGTERKFSFGKKEK